MEQGNGIQDTRQDVGLESGRADEETSVWAADRMGCGKIKCSGSFYVFGGMRREVIS